MVTISASNLQLFELTADAELNVMSDSLCTIIRFLESIVVFACVFTLVGICFERYNAIVNPVQSRINMTNCRIRRVLTLVWIVSILLSSPNLYPATAVFHSLYSDFGEFTRVTCFDGFSDTFRFVYFLTLFLLVFFLPLGFITTTCFSIARELFKEIPAQQSRDSRSIHLEQGRRKVAKMVLVIVLSFLLCWSPYFSVTLVTQLQSENFLHGGQYFFTMLLINLFAFANSCINPFIYFAMSTRFRRGFLSIMCSSCRTTTSQQRLGSHAMPSSNQTTNGVMTRQTTFSLRILSTQRESMRRENVSRRESRAGVGVGKTIIISQPACAE
ncbi:QRFP-like peptide receptor [Folsomia candida]|uniref:QRFP-like peptide receptor n=1 Tax=Folsomia candida TaxID=158441 RepID=UPI001605076B|nr:QRFP-like peptide receptor [Folsomia candida]